MKKKSLVFALIIIILISVFSGCKDKIPDNPNVIEIYITKAGYGIDWLYEIKDAFLQENPQYEIYIDYDEVSLIRNKLLSGANNNTADLMLGTEKLFGLHHFDSNFLANLTDIYDSKVPGEDIYFKDKLISDYLNQMSIIEEIDGEYIPQYYMVPYAMSVNTFVYNESVLNRYESDGAFVPKTTDEFIRVADVLKSKNINPFVSSLSVSYWVPIYEAWWAQYEGKDTFNQFWEGKVDGQYSEEIFLKKGRLYSLEVMDEILHKSNGRSDKDSASLHFTVAQTKVISGNAVFNPCGDWFESEMSDIIKESNNQDSIKLLKMPIISAITDKLSFWEFEEDYQAASQDSTKAVKLAEYDQKLSDLVKYVDGEISKPNYQGVDADIAVIRAARRVTSSYGTGHQAVIPAYSNAIEPAKEFLRFLATDTAQRIFIKNTKGSSLPFIYDYKDNIEEYAAFSDFAKSRIEIVEQANFLPMWANKKMYWLAGMTDLAYGFNTIFADDNTHKTPVQIYEASRMNKRDFENLLKNAGLI